MFLTPTETCLRGSCKDYHGRSINAFTIHTQSYLLKIVPGLISLRSLRKNVENPLYSQLGWLEGIEK